MGLCCGGDFGVIGDGKIFPTLSSLFIFILYMALFIAQGILVTASRNGAVTYTYDVTTTVLLAETLKLFVAIGLYFGGGSSVASFLETWRKQGLTMLSHYLIPSALYAIYNNLSFWSLAKFDPTTYYLLLQFRVVVTGVIFQWLFNKRLSKVQWLSLIILTFGCILKEFNSLRTKFGSDPQVPSSDGWNYGLTFIVVQIFCSCFAGVYNEYLLKDRASEVNIWFQNCCMYLDSMLCNLIALGFRGNLISAFSQQSLLSVVNVKVLAIICDNAAIGIVTALFLKKLNSILKSFASALEIMFTAILCWIIFSIAIDIYTVGAIVVVSFALLLYAKHPIANVAKLKTSDGTLEDEGSSEKLLPTVQVET